jgi:hypothetical protein
MRDNQTILDDLIAEHIPYEVIMMRETYDLLFAGAHPEGIVRNALIESFAIHARALTDFFNGRKGCDARLFTRDGYLPFKNGKVSGRLVEKLNQQIPHITQKRYSDSMRKLNGKDIRELCQLLDQEVYAFMRCLTPHYFGMWDLKGQLDHRHDIT